MTTEVTIAGVSLKWRKVKRTIPDKKYSVKYLLFLCNMNETQMSLRLSCTKIDIMLCSSQLHRPERRDKKCAVFAISSKPQQHSLISRYYININFHTNTNLESKIYKFLCDPWNGSESGTFVGGIELNWISRPRGRFRIRFRTHVLKPSDNLLQPKNVFHTPNFSRDSRFFCSWPIFIFHQREKHFSTYLSGREVCLGRNHQ